MGDSAFKFKKEDKSGALVMRSSDMSVYAYWLDLPKLASLITVEKMHSSHTFCYPHHVILDSNSYQLQSID